MKKENVTHINEGFRTKKDRINEEKQKEDFAKFYSSVLKVESQKRQSSEQINRKSKQAV